MEQTKAGLEREKLDLERKLAGAVAGAAKRRKSGEDQDRLDEEVVLLQARLATLEAEQVPYTKEELALLQDSRLEPGQHQEITPRTPSFPPGSERLIEEGHRAFAARRFEEAEQKFLEVLKLDERNIDTLINVAAVQFEQGHLDEAESTLRRALALDSRDPFSLSLLGIVQFEKNNFDEALKYLSQAAHLDPRNAETQNFLGITLAQKGQRKAAETALRKAIELSPGYGAAHHNLAVIYAAQQPPFLELARWHYQRALASGHEPNPELEQVIESR